MCVASHIPAFLNIRPVTGLADTRNLFRLYRHAVLAVQVSGPLRYCKCSVGVVVQNFTVFNKWTENRRKCLYISEMIFQNIYGPWGSVPHLLLLGLN
jgi:hypothetical protein